MKLDYKGTSIFYSQAGKGRAVVLLHGFLESSTMWKDWLSLISKSHQVVCVDLLGHGKTGCLGYIHTMEQMAEAVDAVLKHLEIKKATFIGHSMGGYVALAYLELFPKKIEGLCLMNSTALDDSPEKKQNRDRAIAAVKKNHKIFIRLSISNLFRPKNRIMYSNEIQSLKEEALQFPIQGIIAALEGMKVRKNRVELFRKAVGKKMMIIGRKDPALQYNTLVEQTKNSDIEMVEFPDGHMTYIENKKEVTYKIMYFIEK
ncbi:alpha/beta fold hydrolase [Flavobacteriaceae bacterium LMO-SS05]